MIKRCTIMLMLLFIFVQPAYASSFSSAKSFLKLTDTPDSYAGQGGNCAAVNGGETAMEFIACGGGGGTSVTLDLGDDAANESAGITELATTGDTNSIFTEPSANKLLIDLTKVWPANQPLDSDLTTYAGITPSANVQSILGAADYSAVRTLLSLVIGTNVQAYDTDLTTYAGITPSANVQSILGAADYAAVRTLLSLVIGTNVQAYDADLTTYAGITPSADIQTFLGYTNLAAIKAGLSVDDLVTLSGVADGATHLGTFTGVTIADSSTVKAALQAVETELETKIEAADVPANETDAAHDTCAEIAGCVQNAITGVTADAPLSGAGTSASHLVLSTAGAWSGNAGTATALFANGGNCSAGNYPLGVDASGAVETCTADDDAPDSDGEVPDAITVTMQNNSTLVNGTGPTADASGEAVVDTTEDQFKYYGSALNVVSGKYEFCKTIQTPVTTDDNVPIFSPQSDITIIGVYCRTQGGTSVGLTISDGTNALEEVACDSDGQADDGSISNGAFVANERMEFDTGTVTGTVDWLNFCVRYRLDSK